MSKYAEFFPRADVQAFGVIWVPGGPGDGDLPELRQNHLQPVRIYSFPEVSKLSPPNLSSVKIDLGWTRDTKQLLKRSISPPQGPPHLPQPLHYLPRERPGYHGRGLPRLRPRQPRQS